jgi:hypothetical protein
MKGLFLIYGLLIAALPATNMNCSNTVKSEKGAQKATEIMQNSDTTVFKNQKGIVHIYVCSRGCYQYVLETTIKEKLIRLSPDVMAEAFKKDNMAVVFSGKLTTEMVDIKKPAPNDVPILDFKAPKIMIENMEEVK